MWATRRKQKNVNQFFSTWFKSFHFCAFHSFFHFNGYIRVVLLLLFLLFLYYQCYISSWIEEKVRNERTKKQHIYCSYFWAHVCIEFLSSSQSRLFWKFTSLTRIFLTKLNIISKQLDHHVNFWENQSFDQIRLTFPALNVVWKMRSL